MTPPNEEERLRPIAGTTAGPLPPAVGGLIGRPMPFEASQGASLADVDEIARRAFERGWDAAMVDAQERAAKVIEERQIETERQAADARRDAVDAAGREARSREQRRFAHLIDEPVRRLGSVRSIVDALWNGATPETIGVRRYTDLENAQRILRDVGRDLDKIRRHLPDLTDDERRYGLDR